MADGRYLGGGALVGPGLLVRRQMRMVGQVLEPFSPADLRSVPGQLLCSTVSGRGQVEDRDRDLVAAVGGAFVAAQATATEAVERRVSRLERWQLMTEDQREPVETRVASLLGSGWSIHMLGPAAVAETTHHHVGSLVGLFDLSRCTSFAEPWFTKPLRAFWTCPLPPGRGSAGFESMAAELDPDRSYSSYRLDFSDTDRVFVVDTLDDWEWLLDLCGSDSSRTQSVPDYGSLPTDWAAVHVTNRALLRFEAAHTRDPAQVTLADWALESTAWIQPSNPPRVSRIAIDTIAL